MTVFTNRLKNQRSNRLVKSGRKLTPIESKRYGDSKQLHFVAGVNEPIYPIGYARFRKPVQCRNGTNCYSAEGRVGLHDNLRINTTLMLELMRNPPNGASIQLADNQMSLFSAQWGKCAVTGMEFQNRQEICCHHISPKHWVGFDSYANLKLVHMNVENLIQAKDEDAIKRYLLICNLNNEQLEKVNVLRKKAGLATI